MRFTIFTRQKHQEIITWSAELKAFSSAVSVVNQTASAFHALMAVILRRIAKWHESLCLLSSLANIFWNPKYSVVLRQKAVSAYFTSKQIVSFGFAEQFWFQLSCTVCRYFRCVYGQQYLHYSDLIGADERAWKWLCTMASNPVGDSSPIPIQCCASATGAATALERHWMVVSLI